VGRRLRVFVVEDSAIIRGRILDNLSALGYFEVVGYAESADEAVERIRNLQPDVIITDISMPKLNGIEAVNRLRESGSTSKVVFLTVHADPDFVQAAFKTGALAYVSKLRIRADLLVAIRGTLEGRVFVSPTVASSDGTS